MMRKISLFLAMGAAVLLIFSGEASARRKTIVDFFDSKSVIKTYVAGILNSSGDNKIDVKDLEHNIEEAFDARISHHFQIVRSKQDADIIINIEIVEYVYTDRDPIDMVAGLTSAVYDALMTEHYARMRVNVSIFDAKKNKELWKDRFKSTITDAAMTEEESYGRINRRLPKIFLKRLFKKRRR